MKSIALILINYSLRLNKPWVFFGGVVCLLMWTAVPVFADEVRVCPPLAPECGDSLSMSDSICERECTTTEVGEEVGQGEQSYDEEMLVIGHSSGGMTSFSQAFMDNFLTNFFTEGIGRFDQPDTSGGSLINPDGVNDSGDGKTAKETSCHPVSFATGLKIERTVDYKQAGAVDMPLHLTRTLTGYIHTKDGNGLLRPGLFGVGWTSNFDNRLEIETSIQGAVPLRCFVFADGTVRNSSNCDFASYDSAISLVLYLEGKRAYFSRISVGSGSTELMLNESMSDFERSDLALSFNASTNQWIISFTNGITYTYRKNGMLEKVSNLHGISHTYNYDSANKLASVVHSSGKKLEFFWGGVYVSSVRTPDGNTISYSGDIYADKNKTRFQLIDVEYENSPGDLTYEYNSDWSKLTGVYLDDVKYKEISYVNADGKVASSGLVGGVEVSSFEYDDDAYTTTVRNAKGAETVYKYNYKRKALIGIDRKAGTSAHCPDAASEYGYQNGKPEQMLYQKDWRGNITSYSYYPYPNDDLVETTYHDGKTELYVWDAYERLKSKTTWVGALPQVDCSLNSCALQVYETDQYLSKEVYTYGGGNNRLSSVDVYDDMGNVSSVKYSYTFHSNKMVSVKTVDGPRTDVNDKTTFRYSSTGNLLSIENALGHKTTYSYSGTKTKPYRMDDPNNYREDYTYDGRNRLTKKIAFESSSTLTTTFAYNRFGKVSSISAPGFNRAFSYDNAGRYTGWQESQSPNPAYDDVRYKRTYDKLSNLVDERTTYRLTELNGSTPIYTDVPDVINKWRYDDLGNLEAVLTDLDQVATSFTYDEALNIKSVKNAQGFTTEFGYDAENRLLSSKNGANESVAYTYHPDGTVESVTDANGNSTIYERIGSRKVIRTSPDTGVTEMDYDAAGNMVKLRRNSGVEVAYTYDALNRLTKVLSTGSSSSKVSITYQYDSYSSSCSNGKGRLCSVSDGSGLKYFSYTPSGRLARQFNVNGFRSFDISYQYDGYGRLSIENHSSSFKIRYGYGVDSVLNKVDVFVNNAWKNVVSEMPGPKTKKLTFGNGLVTDYYFDGDGGLTKISSPVYEKQYGLYNDNKLSGEYKLGANLTKKLWHTYKYDAGGHLIHSYVSGASGDVAKAQEDWTYDNNGNIETYTNNGNTYTWGYESSTNKMVSRSMASNTVYNDDGNVTRAYGLWGFGYDDLNRVNKLSYPAPLDITLKLNYQNHRVFKQVKDNYANKTSYQLFVYDTSGKLIIEEYYPTFGNKTMEKHYVYFGGQLVGYVYNNTLYYVHNDHLGRPEVLTNSSKSVVWQAKYSTFGIRGYIKSNSGLDFQVGLPGQYFDKNVNMWYNWNRYYDGFSPSSGRYMQSDPIGLAGGLNTYLYAGGDPVNFVDPNGLWSISVEAYGGIGGGITFGKHNLTGQWFVGGRLGIGLGLGANLNILNNGPMDRDLLNHPYADEASCSPKASGNLVGTNINLGANWGPYEGSYGGGGGRYFDGSDGYYSEGPGFGGQFNPLNYGAGIGASATIEVYGW